MNPTSLSIEFFTKRLKKREASLTQARARQETLERDAKAIQDRIQEDHNEATEEWRAQVAELQAKIQADGSRRQQELTRLQAPLRQEAGELHTRVVKLEGQIEELKELLGLDEEGEDPDRDLQEAANGPYPQDQPESPAEPAKDVPPDAVQE